MINPKTGFLLVLAIVFVGPYLYELIEKRMTLDNRHETHSSIEMNKSTPVSQMHESAQIPSAHEIGTQAGSALKDVQENADGVINSETTRVTDAQTVANTLTSQATSLASQVLKIIDHKSASPKKDDVDN